jgi:hypothetical protein
MQPSSFGDAPSLPRVARQPRARLGGFTKPRIPVAADEVEKASSNDNDVVECHSDGHKDDPSSAQAGGNAQRVPISYIPRTRAVSPYTPHSERADVILQELIHYCMSPHLTLGGLKLKEEQILLSLQYRQ